MISDHKWIWMDMDGFGWIWQRPNYGETYQTMAGWWYFTDFNGNMVL